MKITIGRAEDNTLVINEPEISRYHAVLMRDENDTLYLEDLLTPNGSFVNDNQVMVKKLSLNDKLAFGTNFTINLSDLLHGFDEYGDDFYLLKDVYNKYVKEKIRIQSRNQFKTRIFQTLPFALIGIFGMLMSLLGQTNHFLFVLSCVLAVCAPVTGIYLGARQAAKIPALLQNLANQFKIDYVCPKCGAFLGEIPWESLLNKKQCPVVTCRAKWIRN